MDILEAYQAKVVELQTELEVVKARLAESESKRLESEAVALLLSKELERRSILAPCD